MRKKIRLTKLSDDAFKGKHPNNIQAGYTIVGYMLDKPKKGERFLVYTTSRFYPEFGTSVVVEKLNKDNIFKTTYSTYKIEYLK